MINNLRFVGLSLLVLLGFPGSARSTSEEILEAINRTCVFSAEMALGAIRLGDSRRLVESRLGSPNSRTDPGGTSVLHYDGLKIRLHASRAQSILATSPRWTTPSGIRAGVSVTQASEILGFDLDSLEPPHSKSPRGYRIHQCIEAREQMDAEHYLRLGLSPDRSIVEVEVFWTAP